MREIDESGGAWVMECPECGRVESHASKAALRAWQVGHYLTEHPDELPPFRNPEDDE